MQVADPTHRGFRAALGLLPMPLRPVYLVSWLDYDRSTIGVTEVRYEDRERAITWACNAMRAGRLEETITAYGFIVTLKSEPDGKLAAA